MSQNGGSAAAWVIGGSVALVLTPVIMMVAVSGGSSAAGGGAGSGVGGGLKGGAVPAQYVPWVLKAGALCDVIKPAVVAAQIEAESGWNPNAVSPVGAEGLSQFMPGTWKTWGRDDDGNGRVSPYDPGDAIMAQGRYDCALAEQVEGYKKRGEASGETLDLALAAYNAGPGAVQQYHGIPPYTETRNYVARIKSLIPKYESVDDPPGKVPPGQRMAMPLRGNPPVTSPYGMRFHPILHVNKLHTGIDFGATQGTPFLAARDGKVTFAGWSNGYGNRVVISHGTIDGKEVSTTYNHMSAFSVSVGQRVKVGQQVGAVGSTGYSTGPHAHFEVIQNGDYVDPAPWLGLK
ncbi:peptidoglycan DD-metalloendopeptidase family protein [Streptomyces sp. R1]|uniref:peptidoglycan DD-metalloendopeptidase family protein n=1 Tax=Streptomyces TaxID=1883 RepID=UPI00052AE13D|nr:MULTISPECIES: peptidoglycan DD-metalloendopeptidase family protein [unclassified Streptomyces]AIV34830.1 peptidase M23 [Streptomyces sp. CCM_MD2014]MCC8335893.1 peptidoglycan DD-metalloendopeptidase family protein [Streptomyces sp. R1]MDA4886350.1 peptidoglycan DD-metalloendopeptidase family protein [Streptomyces sp. MS2A]MYS48908.1 peptidoglycan DD-metalloendopeptidase family protein [Streptomyces sp. SID6013]